MSVEFVIPDPAVIAFVCAEARYMDEQRYDEWLSLWASEDVSYWVPCGDDDGDPARQVSIIFDDRTRLEQRINRLKSGTVMAQQGAPFMRRVVSNFELVGSQGDVLEVASNFALGYARGSDQYNWFGRSEHLLREKHDSFEIVRKKVVLINNDQPLPLLQFLI